MTIAKPNLNKAL